MNAPTIHGHFVPASRIKEALGDALSAIRHEDRLTWADIGAVLGKGEDQAPKYADGSAEMGAVACFRAKQMWGERFTGRVNALLSEARPPQDGQAAQSCILRAALGLAEALEDGTLTDAEIRQNRSKLERAHESIAAMLARLGPKQTGAA